MTVQVPDQRQNGRRKHPVYTGLVIIFLAGVAIIWFANLGSAFAGALGIVFTLVGILIALLQWRLQSPIEVQVQAKEASAGKQGPQPLYEQVEDVVLGTDKHKGALVVYTRKNLRGSPINVSFGFHSDPPKVDLAASVIGRRRKGSTVYLAVFSALEPGNYTVYTDARDFVIRVSISSGRVVEVDWR